MSNKLIIEEYIKCINSPYYFAIKYIKIKGKLSDDLIPFRTSLSEEEFNKQFKLKIKASTTI
jgi:hypothetical protein